MRVINVEIKAKSGNQDRIRDILRECNADFRGKDHQVDTYFSVSAGRLKLREGEIENNLIYYERPDKSGPKTSRCIIYPTDADSPLKRILENSMGIMVVVDKQREIYFIENIKIHLDLVKGLGTFVEIEAQGKESELIEEYLLDQCKRMMLDLGVHTKDLISESYSDLMMMR